MVCRMSPPERRQVVIREDIEHKSWPAVLRLSCRFETLREAAKDLEKELAC